MFCYLVYASSQSRGVEKSQLHKGSSALSFFFFASVSPAQGRMTAIYQALSNEVELLSSPPGILKFRGCVTPSVSQGIKEGPAAKSICPIRRWWARAASGPCAVGRCHVLGHRCGGRTGRALRSVPASGQVSP